MPAANAGAVSAAAVILLTAPKPASLSLGWAGVTGPPAKNENHGPEQSAGNNDKADQQPAQQPQAQTETDPDGEPDAEEPEADPEADPQADPQARREAFDLETDDGRSVSAPDGGQDESRQAAGRDGASRACSPKPEQQSKSAGAEADSGAESSTGVVA
ncbi:hypothetical protein [Mycolicibacterium llatzerense]|uniref:hypothetical protein n=1 Tax=Mycolicibacterium llatzerense TaxID=280871 RepID=UPI0008DE6108|nr:hypothetical protein [Mycolicibacterium llatzerense]